MAEDLEEASNELIITDDDAVQYSVGETFVRGGQRHRGGDVGEGGG